MKGGKLPFRLHDCFIRMDESQNVSLSYYWLQTAYKTIYIIERFPETQVTSCYIHVVWSAHRVDNDSEVPIKISLCDKSSFPGLLSYSRLQRHKKHPLCCWYLRYSRNQTGFGALKTNSKNNMLNPELAKLLPSQVDMMASETPSTLEIYHILQRILLHLTFIETQGDKESSTISKF